MITWKDAQQRIDAGGTLSREELRQVISKSGGLTAEESERLFRACPEWVAEQEARDAEMQARLAALKAEQELLIADLRRAGRRVDLVSDLMHTADSYPEAIPVLLNHFQRPYGEATKEAIVRSLSVREARGVAGPAIIEALRNSQDNGKAYRWAMANALTVIATRAERDAVKELIDAEASDDVRERLTRALKTAARP